jgi:hypothetical protein
MTRSSRYREIQIGWALLTVFALVLLLILIILRTGPLQPVSLVPLILVLLAAAMFGFMSVNVTDDAVQITMGVGFLRRRVERADIRRLTVVRNPWYWGWGVRLYSAGTGTMYSVHGFNAIELTLGEGRTVRIGTRDPERLLQALRA